MGTPDISGALILCMAVGSFAWLVCISLSRPAWAAAATVGLSGVQSIAGPVPGFFLGGVVTYPLDLLFVALAVAAAARMYSAGVALRVGWPWWSVAILAVVSLWRGIGVFGVNFAGNDFRPWFYLLTGVIFIATCPARRPVVRDVVDAWIAVALILTVVGFARIGGIAIGATEQEGLAGGRALYAQPTLLIGQAALMCFFLTPLDSRWKRFPGLSWVLLVGVVVFQHRTVWVMMSVSLAVMWIALPPPRTGEPGKIGRRIGAFVVGAGVIVLFVAGGRIGELAAGVSRGAETAGASEGTFAWRIEGWQYLLRQQSADRYDLILGIPFGAGYNRLVGGAIVSVSPHSWYVTAITRVGVVGLAVLLLGLVRASRSGQPNKILPRNLGSLLVLSSVLFGIAYQPPETQGFLIGMAILNGVAVNTTGPGNQHDRRELGASTATSEPF